MGGTCVLAGCFILYAGGNFWSGALAGAFASVSGDLLDIGIKNAGEFSVVRSKGFALLTGAVCGGTGSVLGGGNFWMGAAQGLIVTAFNYLAHREEFPDNGYDKNGKKVNDNGGNSTDYIYDDNGKVISSTSVEITTSQGGELSYSIEGYGYRHYNQGTGGALTDPSFGLITDYVLGKAAWKGLGIVGEYGGRYFSKKSAQFIISNAKYLNKNNWIRIGEGTGKGAGHIRISVGAHPNYINDVPKSLRRINQWLRNNIGKGGHIDFINWKW